MKIYSAGGSEGIFEWEFDGDWSSFDFTEQLEVEEQNLTNIAIIPQNSILAHTFGDTVS